MLQALPPVFAGLQPEDIATASALLQPLELEAGEVVMERGEVDTTLAFIGSGAVSIEVGGVRVGGAGARDMLGLVELFTGHPRAATVVASGPLQLQVLAPEAWTELCENGHPAVFNIERASIRRLGDRLRHYVDGIAERTRGSVLELQPARTGLLERLSKSLRPPAAPSVQALEILQGSDLFSWAAPTVLEAIAARCDRQVFEEGHALCSQGEDAKCMWVVAKGEVDQVIRLEGGRVETLATLKPGDAFGDESMALGSARTLSYVAREGGVALAIGRERYLEFFSVDDAAGSVFRQGMCRNMVRQLMAAQKRFVQLASLEAPEEEMIHGTPVSTVWRD